MCVGMRCQSQKRQWRKLWGVGGILVILLWSSGAFASPTKTASAHRIVSLTGPVTEALFALGVGQHVVGRDTSSYYPAQVKKIPTVGYQHRLNAEGILRLKPSLVIGTTGVKPHFVLKQIKAAGIRVLLLKKAKDVATSQQMLRALGQALKKEKRAEALISSMNKALKTLTSFKKKREGKKARVAFLYVRGSRVRFVVGKGNPVSGMIALAGAKNVATFRGVKPVSAEALLSLRPDVIVLFKKGLRSMGGLKVFKRMPGLSLTPAGKKNRFIVMDDLFLGGFGPRCGEAALALFRGIYEAKGTHVVK